MNENPEGLPKDFVDSVLKEITPEFLSIYPEPDRFLRKYAKFVGVGFENLMCTNGSDMAIRYLLETFGEVGKEVVTVAPSFEMYWVNCSILGYRHVPVPYESDLTINVEKIVAAINENTRVVVLLNPNNPVGNVYTDDEFDAVRKRAEEVGALVIVDEAYHYFYSRTFLGKALAAPHVVVLRTFSKLMSLAAVRLGVIIGSPELIGCVRNARLTFDVNSVALLFAERLMDRPDIVEDLIKAQQEGKDWLLSELAAQGYWCRDCMGNFVFVKPRQDAHLVAKRLEEMNVLVHPYGNPLLKDYIRVSTGSKGAMEKFMEAFKEADK
jgi:histidinol-phosphate aminotransferase